MIEHAIDPKVGTSESYPWQDFTWLEKTLGKAKTKNSDKGIAYYWICSADGPNTNAVMYHVMPDKSVIYQGVSCNKAGCGIDNIMPHDGELRNAAMHITMTLPNS
jgi:hypothetical protein